MMRKKIEYVQKGHKYHLGTRINDGPRRFYCDDFLTVGRPSIISASRTPATPAGVVIRSASTLRTLCYGQEKASV